MPQRGLTHTILIHGRQPRGGTQEACSPVTPAGRSPSADDVSPQALPDDVASAKNVWSR